MLHAQLPDFTADGGAVGGIVAFAGGVVLVSLCISVAACRYLGGGPSPSQQRSRLSRRRRSREEDSEPEEGCGVRVSDCPDCEAARRASLRATPVAMWVPASPAEAPTTRPPPPRASANGYHTTAKYTAVATTEDSCLADHWSDSCIEETTDEIFV